VCSSTVAAAQLSLASLLLELLPALMLQLHA
jgi:hypothetical protein